MGSAYELDPDRCGKRRSRPPSDPCAHPKGHAGKHSWDGRGKYSVYSLGDLIDAAQRWQREYGRAPLSRDWRGRSGWPTYAVVNRRFGTWADFLHAAGIPTDCANPLCSKPVKVPGRGDECARCRAYRVTAGKAWSPEGVREAARRTESMRWARRQIREYAAELGRWPSSWDWRSAGCNPRLGVLHRWYPSWKAALDDAKGPND